MDTITREQPPAAGQAATIPARRLSPFKFFIGPGLFRERSTLYRSLDEALVACGEHDTIGLVPSGHAPWKPFYGKTETSPLKPDLYGAPWKVLRVYHYRERSIEDSINYIAAFGHPADAFEFAALKHKSEKDSWSDPSKSDTDYFVCLWAWTMDGRSPEIARMAPDHLSKLRQKAAREERRRYRHAA